MTQESGQTAGAGSPYYSLFEHSPVGMWHEDLAEFAAFVAALPVETEQELRALLADHPELIGEAGSRIRILDVNDRLVELLRAPNREVLIGGFLPETVTPQWIAAFVETLVAVWRGDRTGSIDATIRALDGELRSGAIEWVALDEGDGDSYASTVVAFYDTTERDRLARVVRAVAAAEAAVLGAENERELFQEVCRIVVEGAGYRFAWVGIADDDAEKSIRPQAGWGSEVETLPEIALRWDESVQGLGPSGTAARTGEAVVVQDIAEDDHFAPWREKALARELRSAASVPILGEGLRGMLTVFAGEVRAFGDAEVELLQRLASSLAVGVLALRTRQGLEALVDAKDDFLATVAHELRTPLASIVGFSEILRTDPEHLTPDDVREFTDRIAESARDLTHIVSDLLVAARSRAVALEVVAEPVNLVEEVGSLLSQHPDIVVNVSEGGSVGVGDRTRVRQIIRNLLVNGFRYGGHSVVVNIGRDESRAWVEVCDDGEGVPESMTEAIFEPYVSGGDPLTAPGSMGLGLPVSRHLARRMSGDLVLLQDEEWVRFRLTLPLAEG